MSSVPVCNYLVRSYGDSNSFSVMSAVKAHLQTYDVPININSLSSFGFLLFIFIMLQIVTGILLASFYTPSISLASYSISHIIREVWSGWYFRSFHSIGASFVFALAYIHIMRSFAYGSYLVLPLTWISGIIIFCVLMMTAFYGYVLPWGQLSYWGATVITSFLSSMPTIWTWYCGGYYISSPTLKRFFVLHFTLPFVCCALILIHVFTLHLLISNNPLGYAPSLKISFYPIILYLDFKVLSYVVLLFIFQTFFAILPLSHPSNAEPASIFATPLHIVPEWYFLSFYAMLKSLPSRSAGLALLVSSILILFLFSKKDIEGNTTSSVLSNSSASMFSASFLWTFWCLLIIGAQLPQDLFIMHGRIFVCLFFWFALLLLLPSKSKNQSGLLVVPLSINKYTNASF